MSTLDRDTRFSDRYVMLWLGTTPGQEHLEIKGSKLPSNKQVLLCLLANLKEHHWNNALSNVIDNVLLHYRKANIPTFTGRNNIGRVIKTYYEKYIKLIKVNKDTRNIQNPAIATFQSDLEKTMRLYRNSVLKDMAATKKGKTPKEIDAINHDIEFMKSMMSDRKASYSRIDKAVTKIQQREERNKQKLNIILAQESNMEESFVKFASSSSESEDQEFEDEGMDLQKRVHTRTVKSGVTVFIPHDILKSRELVACSIRNNISSTKLSAVLHTLISACGEDPSKVSLDPSTVHR